MSSWPYGYGRHNWGHANYPSINLTDSSPAQTFEEVLDLDSVKAYLKLPIRNPPDAQEDDQITEFIAAAREQAEILQNRDLVRKSYDLTQDYWPFWRFHLRDPLVSVDLVQYTDFQNIDHQLTEETDYIVDKTKHPGLILPPYNGVWPSFTPRPSSAILVRFTSGYSSTDPFWLGPGSRIKGAMKLLISAWFNNHLPFEKGIGCTNEYPYAVTSGLSYGALERAR